MDRFGRVGTDLRVSLTERCNLRCQYCMPAEGMPWMATSQTLDDDEVTRLIAIAVRELDVREVRFTGAEPLLRKGLESIIAATVTLRTSPGEPPQTSVTTNGLGLERRAPSLVRAGLSRVNVSLDTLDAERYRQITRRDRLHDVISGLRAAQQARLAPIKINAVLMRGVNDDEAVSLTGWAIKRGHALRFIEQMPLGPQGEWDRTRMITAAEILEALQGSFDLVPLGRATRGAAPAQTWHVGDSMGRTGTVGIIASVTQPFCGDCDRTRLTTDGQVRSCLFGDGETDLRLMLRSGSTDADIAAAWRSAMWTKPSGHGIGNEGFHQLLRSMSAIGG